ncbi:hypothetical protein [Anaerostipes sp.]|uniref:hypothetical protein n=1 Tax=Anaerostipes sp. TaxID=1872530 RepID=UPI0025BD87BB|nr:hypothetical protein [Anaerostipes sp.]MBS7007574.1 hypothetical protein [Anaerostipes sp.]
MHRIFDIIERIGKPQNMALSHAIDIVYQINSVRYVKYIYHNLCGISCQLLCDELISKDEMEMMQQLFFDFCSNRIKELKEQNKKNELSKKKFKFW